MTIDIDRTVGDFPLAGKIVAVTGGGSGISLEFARQAAAAGAKVLIADLKLTPEAQSFVESSTDTVSFQNTNVTHWPDLEGLHKAAHSLFGATPDVYVAGAGLFEPPSSSFWEDAEQERYTTVDVNVSHVMKLTRIAMQALVRENKKGVVLSISSRGGLVPLYGAPMYCATKAAVIGFTRGMLLADMLEGDKVVTICPGVVDTPLWTPDKRKNVGMNQFRLIKAEDVAAVMIALVQEGRYGGGTVMVVRQGEQGAVTSVEPEDDNPLLALKPGGELPAFVDHPKMIMDSQRGTHADGSAGP